MICLLDTVTFIFMVRGLKASAPKNDRQRERMEMAKRIAGRCRARQVAGDEVGLSAITVAELEYGARRSEDYGKEINAVQKILTPFNCYDFDATSCARRYGEVRYALEIAGATIGAMDLLIAGHAKALGAILVTSDMDHFSRVPDLRCEDWAT